MTDLVGAGVRLPVRADEAVAQEVSVAGRVDTVVSAVSPVPAAFSVDLEQALVYPVPDKSALEVVVLVDLLPLEVKRTGGVAHGVGILRRYYGPV